MKRSRPDPLIGKEDPQLGLFGEPDDDPTLEVASERDALLTLAGRLPPLLRFGTSSWTFPGWAGLVYHRRYSSQRAFLRESLEEYAAHPLMCTVGIDRSYYAPVPEPDLALYADQLPEGFKCAMKVWQRVTMPVYPRHPRYGAEAGRPNPDFLNPDLFRTEVFEPVQRALGRAMGPFILEIAPSPVPLNPRWFVERLCGFLAAVPREFPMAVELRDRRLLSEGYVQALRDYEAGHVFNYWSRMPSLAAQMGIDGLLTGSVCVVRLLLPPGAKYADLKAAYAPFDRLVEPQPAMRRDVARLVEAALARQMEVYVLVNNKAEGSSPLTVRALGELLAR